jgi:hypothetical protein
MEDINNFDDLFSELTKNNSKCVKKIITLSYADFRRIIRSDFKIGYKKPLEFENCIFRIIYNDDANEIPIDNTLSFSGCVFETDFKIEKIVFNTEKISFDECNFNGNIEFIDICQASTYYSNFLFEFSHCNFNNGVISIFRVRNNQNTVISFNFSENENENNFHFEDFNHLVVSHFSYAKLKKFSFFRIDSLTLNLSTEIDTLELEETNLDYIRDDFKIQKYIFDKSIISSGFVPRKHYEIQSIKATNSEFKRIIDLTVYKVNELNFEDCEFEEKVLFVKCELKLIKFENCSFEKTIKIVDSIGFIEHVSFHRSTVKRFLIFNGLYKNIINLDENSDIDFSYIFVESTGHIIIRNINYIENQYNGSLNFKSSNILGIVTIEDSKFYSLDFQKSTIEGQFHIEDVEVINYNNRETIVKIKNEYIKKNDKVKALEYQAKEYEQYLLEINIPLIKNISNIKPKFIRKIVGGIFLPFLLIISLFLSKKNKNISEYTLLYFNQISNSFGISWSKGVIFTMITAFVFYCLINYCGTDSRVFEIGWENWNSFGEVWRGYLNILNVFNFNNQIDGIKMNVLGETFFLLSKIFIAFGVYQTIAAFRKYGK